MKSMLKTIIIDDEFIAVKSLKISIEKYCPNFQIIDTCTEIETAIQIIREKIPDVIFLDMDMGQGQTGFDLLKNFQMGWNFAVVAVSAFPEKYAAEAFTQGRRVVHFLSKPIDPNLLRQAYQFCLEWRSNRKMIFPICGGGYVLIHPEEIVCIEAKRNHSLLYFTGSTTFVELNLSISEVEEKLRHNKTFGRFHNSFIINFKQIKRILPASSGGFELLMSNGIKSLVASTTTQTSAFRVWLKEQCCE